MRARFSTHNRYMSTQTFAQTIIGLDGSLDLRVDIVTSPRTAPVCARCANNDGHDVPHFNCLYAGKRIGHSTAHCTANACY